VVVVYHSPFICEINLSTSLEHLHQPPFLFLLKFRIGDWENWIVNYSGQVLHRLKQPNPFNIWDPPVISNEISLLPLFSLFRDSHLCADRETTQSMTPSGDYSLSMRVRPDRGYPSGKRARAGAAASSHSSSTSLGDGGAQVSVRREEKKKCCLFCFLWEIEGEFWGKFLLVKGDWKGDLLEDDFFFCLQSPFWRASSIPFTTRYRKKGFALGQFGGDALTELEIF